MDESMVGSRGNGVKVAAALLLAFVCAGCFWRSYGRLAATHAELLAAMARKEPRLPYVGMIGSSRKIAKAIADMKAAGIDPGPDVYAPVGLDLGGDTPGEIALAIASQILGVLHGKEGLPHYRDRHVPR
jgi:xanthine/CO dehydrogenase XdhC/CoxF family maturation factor